MTLHVRRVFYYFIIYEVYFYTMRKTKKKTKLLDKSSKTVDILPCLFRPKWNNHLMQFCCISTLFFWNRQKASLPPPGFYFSISFRIFGDNSGGWKRTGSFQGSQDLWRTRSAVPRGGGGGHPDVIIMFVHNMYFITYIMYIVYYIMYYSCTILEYYHVSGAI